MILCDCHLTPFLFFGCFWSVDWDRNSSSARKEREKRKIKITNKNKNVKMVGCTIQTVKKKKKLKTFTKFTANVKREKAYSGT